MRRPSADYADASADYADDSNRNVRLMKTFVKSADVNEFQLIMISIGVAS